MNLTFELPQHAKDAIKRQRRQSALIWAGIIWSFVYTALSLLLIVNLNSRLEDSCTSRQAARTAIRQAFHDRNDWSDTDQIELDINLPPLVKC